MPEMARTEAQTNEFRETGELREFLHGFYTAVKITHSSSDGSKITSLCRSCVETWNSKNDGLWLSIVTPEVARPRSRRSFDGENARWRVRFHTSERFPPPRRGISLVVTPTRAVPSP